MNIFTRAYHRIRYGKVPAKIVEQAMAQVAFTGLYPDPPDVRDRLWESPANLRPVPNPSLVHFSCGIKNQATSSSCVGHALTNTSENVETHATGQKVQRAPFYPYYYARLQFGTPVQDAGTTLRAGLKTGYHEGLTPMWAWPTVMPQVNVRPSTQADEQAQPWKIVDYARIKSLVSEDYLETIRKIDEALQTGHSVFVGMKLDRSFFYLKGPMPHAYVGVTHNTNADYVGNHAVVIVAILDGNYVIENSWSEQWGDLGRVAIPKMAVVPDAFDVWVVRDFAGFRPAEVRAKRNVITALYVGLFGRAPDAVGLQYWVGQLATQTMAQIADVMYGTEPARTYYPIGMSNSDIVRSIYNNVLGRAPDAGGLAYWTDRLSTSSPGLVLSELLQAVMNYPMTATDPQGQYSANRLARLIQAGRVYAEKGGTIQGSVEALVGV